MDMSQIRSNQVNTYIMRLQGVLNCSIIDWCSDVTIIAQDQDKPFQVSLTIDAKSLRSFLDQFQDLSLTVLPNDGAVNKTLRNNNAR
jgi:hypothetical protein